MNNSYLILRHGRNIHQTEKADIVYGWPSEDPPCFLDDVGVEQIKAVAENLKEKEKKGELKVDLIFASDILRTRQSAEIVAEKLGLEITCDERLRDINWGIFQGRQKKEAWAYYKNMAEKFTKAVPEGDSWNDCRARMLDFLKEMEERYKDKTILIVSHGDPLLLLECSLKGLSDEEIMNERKKMINVGELRILY
ncbi:MAG: histidine phosphatase family protein [bacterium]